MSLRTRKPKDRVVEISVEKQGSMTEIHVRLRLPSTWINRISSVLLSLLLVVAIAYQPVITPELIERVSHWIGS